MPEVTQSVAESGLKSVLPYTVVLVVHCTRAFGGGASKAESSPSLWCRSVNVERKGHAGLVLSGCRVQALNHWNILGT